MKRKSTKRTEKLTDRTTERPRLNLDEVHFVLDMNAAIVGALSRISKLEVEMAELQSKVLVKP